MLVALAISIVISLAVGIWAARSEMAERIILPVVDILQTLPILAFFPFVIYVVIVILPPYFGINAAVVFLIITSMLWNIIFGVYESIKTLPNEFLEVAGLYRMGLIDRLRKIYIPAAMPRVAEQSMLSWAIGLFYLVTSEIFSTGSKNYAVSHGIGVALTQLALSGNYTGYWIGLTIFILFVIVTRFLLFGPFERKFTQYNKAEPGRLHPKAHHTRFRLFLHLENLYRKDMEKKIHRRMRKAETANMEPIFTPVLMEIHRKRGLRLRIYAAIVIALVIVFLVYANVINWTTINYEGIVLENLAASFLRVWLTFVVILAVAVPLCVYMVFMSRKSDHYLTLFQIVASIPATIVLPIIAVAVSGLAYHDELVAFLVFFLSGIWYVIFSVMAEAKTLSPEIAEVKNIFSVKGFRAWKNIYIKAIMPGLITGAVTAIAAEWNASIVAEYFTSTGVGAGTVISQVSLGIGKLLDISLAQNNLMLMLIALINLTIMIILINTFVWKKLYKRVSDVYK
jgi:NitT/TauT family transport system permease protein